MKWLIALCITLLASNECLLAQRGGSKIELGVVYDTITCKLDTKQSYALYLPSYYAREREWPIIYIFEPAARGSLPVTIFKMAAEKWGYIVVGSNNSKNGSWDEVFNAANAMILDTHSKFNINLDRIYTSGFSGGARAAIAVAAIFGSVRGIIGCGAGSPNPKEYKLKKDSSISYVSIIGDVDMNYLEVKQQEQEFTINGINNMRLTWPNGHQWPPPQMIDRAIQWLEYETNNSLSNSTKNRIVNNYVAYRDSLFISDYDKLESIRLSEQLFQNFDVVQSKDILDYRLSKAYKKKVKELANIEKKEWLIQQQYFTKLNSIHKTRLLEHDGLNSIQWWKFEIDKWKRKSNSEDDNIRKMSLRLLNLIGASCAEKSFNYENDEDFELALRLNEIWVHSEPTSMWALWSRAKLFAKNGDVNEAITYLEIAHENGLVKLTSITKPEAFKILSNEPRYIELVSKLSKIIPQ